MFEQMLVMCMSGMLCSAIDGGQDTAKPQSDEAVVRYLLVGMKDQRERLVSGVFRAYGKRSVVQPDGANLDGPVELFCAFDYAHSLLRFDRLEPVANEKGKLAPRQTKFIHSPTKDFYWDEDQTKALFVVPKGSDGRNNGKPFDVRVLGLVYLNQLDKGITLSFACQRLLDATPKNLTGVIHEANGIYRVSWKNKFVEEKLWIDEKRGFSPIRFESRSLGAIIQGKLDEAQISDVRLGLNRMANGFPRHFASTTILFQRTIIALSFHLSGRWLTKLFQTSCLQLRVLK